MVALSEGAKKLITAEIDILGGRNQFHFTTRWWISRNGRFIRWTRERFTLEDARAIVAECPDVLCVQPKSDSGVTLKTRQGHVKSAFLEGVMDTFADRMRWDIQEGRFLTAHDITHRAQVCLLGHQLASDLFGTDSPFGKEVKIQRTARHPWVRFHIVGVMAPRGRTFDGSYSPDETVLVPVTSAQNRLFGERYVRQLEIFFQAGADVDAVIESARAVIRKRHRNTDEFVRHWKVRETIEEFDHFEKVMRIGLMSLAGFSLFVGSIGIMNICLVSVGEKTREIGLRKSVGARRVDIFWQFLTESIYLFFCGGILGIMGSWFAAHTMALLAVSIVPIVPEWPVVLSLPWMLICVIFSLFLGVGFGVYPAMRAARLSPIDALRTEN